PFSHELMIWYCAKDTPEIPFTSKSFDQGIYVAYKTGASPPLVAVWDRDPSTKEDIAQAQPPAERYHGAVVPSTIEGMSPARHHQENGRAWPMVEGKA
ncbi:unnamed protein product, partial [Closterium sp. Yama58-4]